MECFVLAYFLVEYYDMLSLISSLVTPAALPSRRSLAQISTGTGTQVPVAGTPLRANDSFSVAVGTKEATEIGALTGARRNAGEGASLLQVADTGLGEIGDALTRMKELATLAKTTSYSRGERAIINAEFADLSAEIDSIVDRTEFNDIKVLEGTSLPFKVGTGNASQDRITVSISAATVAGLDAGLASDRIDDESSASQALTNVTNAIDVLKGIQASVDGAVVRFQGVQRSLTADKNILTALRTDLLVRPVTIGTADNLADLASQEFLSQAAPAAVALLSSAERVLLSTSQLQPIEPSQAGDQTRSQEEPQTKAVERPSAYETGQNTEPASPSETTHSVDIKT